MSFDEGSWRQFSCSDHSDGPTGTDETSWDVLWQFAIDGCCCQSCGAVRPVRLGVVPTPPASSSICLMGMAHRAEMIVDPATHSTTGIADDVSATSLVRTRGVTAPPTMTPMVNP